MRSIRGAICPESVFLGGRTRGAIRVDRPSRSSWTGLEVEVCGVATVNGADYQVVAIAVGEAWEGYIHGERALGVGVECDDLLLRLAVDSGSDGYARSGGTV